MIRCALPLALALLAPAAGAISITEAVVGDFQNQNDPTLVTDSVGPLDIGTNTIAGSIQADCLDDGSEILCVTGLDALDAFTFDLAPGTRLVGISLSASGSAPASYAPSTGIFRDLVVFEGDDGVLNGTASLYATILPLTLAGTYVFGIGQGLADAEGVAAYDWSLALDVAAVPAPAAAPLAFLALGALGFVSVRRRG